MSSFDAPTTLTSTPTPTPTSTPTSTPSSVRAASLVSAGVLALWGALHWPFVERDALWPPWLGAALAAPRVATSPLVALPFALALVALWTLAGRRIVRWLAPEADSLGFGAVVGLGTAATLLAWLGLGGGFSPRAIAAVSLAWGACALVPGARASVVAAAATPPAAGAGPPVAADEDPSPVALKFALAGVVGMQILSLLHALIPPWQPDALYYQLTLPRLYLEAGALVKLPQEPVVSAYPGLGQMLFAVPMAAGRDDLCALFHWVHGVLLVAGTLALARAVRLRVPALAALAVGAVPQLAALGAVPLVDLITAACLTWALVAVVLAHRALGAGDEHLDVSRCAEPSFSRAAALAALCMGFAASNKYLALPAVGLLALALVGLALRRRGVAAAARTAAVVTCVALLPCAPWMLKNARDWGSPLFPLHVPASAPPAVRAVLAEHHAGFTENGRATPAWRLPLDVTFFADPDDINRFQGELGPLALALLPLLALPGRRAPAARALLVYALALCAIWSLASRQARFLFPALPPLFVGLLAPLEASPAGAPALRATCRLVAAAAWLGAAWSLGQLRPANDLPYLAGRETRADYYRSLGPTASLVSAFEALAHEPPGRVLFFWEYRGYLCPRPFLPEHAHRVFELPEATPALLARLRELGVSHVLVNQTIHDEQPPAKQAFPFARALAELVRHPEVRPVPLPARPGPVIHLYRLPARKDP